MRESLSTTRYVLPRRDLGGARKLGWIPFGIGVFAVVFMMFWMGGPITAGIRQPGVGGWLLIGFGLLGLPGLLFGLAMLALGVTILRNASHAEVAVGEGLICAIERIGAIPLRRKRRIAQVVRLVVQKGGVTMTDRRRGTITTYLKDLAMLLAITRDGNSFCLVPAYPAGMLRPLADTLATSLALETQSFEGGSEPPVIEVEEREAGDERPIQDVPRPADTDITCQENPRGVAIAIPPKGLWKGSQGLFFFSCLWLCFIAFFTAIMILGKTLPPWPAWLVVALFWAIGLGMMTAAVHMGKRKVLIAVVNHVLALRVSGPFGTREQQVPLAGIADIRIGPSGVEINDRPVMELQVLPREGKKIGLMSNRTRAEQEWVACILRRLLPPSRMGS